MLRSAQFAGIKRLLAALVLVGTGACEAGLASNGGLDASQAAVAGNTYGQSDIGTKGLQRLDQVEYDNTVHDLTGTSSTPGTSFPIDETYNNFDNIVDVLSISPSLLQSYTEAAAALGAEVTTSAGDAATKATIYQKVAPCAATNTPAAACLQQMATDFGQRAWRRPLTADEVTSLVSIGQSAGGDLPSQVGAVVTAAFTSPYFLFRVETDAAGGGSAAHALNAYELATRLSYFLWRSTPDDALLASAKSGKLTSDAELSAQVDRMLADPKAQAMVTGFASRWLLLNQLSNITPDPNTFVGFNDNVRVAMQSESQRYLQDFVLGDQSLGDMLTANYTYLNDTLATYYGLPLPGSSTMTKATFPSGSTRQGLLTQGSVLVVGSTGATTSPIRRGKLILAQLLCASPDQPPPNIPALPDPTGTNLTLRQALAQHVSNPACSVCHVDMDDLGFAFEGFDGAGKARTQDNGQAIDTSGTYMKATPFKSAADMLPLLAADSRVPNCTTQMMFSYALGRIPTSGDASTLTGLSQDFAGQKLQLPALVRSLVLSAAFRSRQGSGAANKP